MGSYPMRPIRHIHIYIARPHVQNLYISPMTHPPDWEGEGGEQRLHMYNVYCIHMYIRSKKREVRHTLILYVGHFWERPRDRIPSCLGNFH